MSKVKDRIYRRFNRVRPRGRPRGRYNLYNDVKTIVKLAEQYEIHPKQLASSLTQAWKHHTANCGPLTIRRRGQTRKSVIVLISRNKQIISQFSIHLDILRNIDYYVR